MFGLVNCRACRVTGIAKQGVDCGNVAPPVPPTTEFATTLADIG